MKVLSLLGLSLLVA